MSIRLEKKIRQMEEIRDKLRESSAFFLVNYRGLKVAELTEFRKNLRKINASFQVVKNTLVSRSIKGAELEKLEKFLSGPTGMVFAEGDPTAPAKVIKEFMQNHPYFIIKGGILDGRLLEKEQVSTLGSLPGKEVMRSQLLTLMQSSLQKLLIVLNAPLRNLVGVLRAISSKKGGSSMTKVLPEVEEKKTDNKKKEKISKREEIIRAIERMNVLELSELVKELEDRFGVEAVAPVAAPPASTSEEKVKEEEKTEFDVVLAEIGSKKIQVIKEVRKLTSLGLKEAKDLVEAAPKTVKQGVTKEEADKIKKTLEAVGAKVELK
ncbi:MAG: 50S ribosomal protein L10 [Candidatus Aerophobetes bacterium]|nr:50S ribosomal protein L10 [Candidatus Aerophobetes bacterium]